MSSMSRASASPGSSCLLSGYGSRRSSFAVGLSHGTSRRRVDIYSPPWRAVTMDGSWVTVKGETSLGTVQLILDDNVDEADGLPASIPFGPHAALVNLDYVRLRYPQSRSDQHRPRLWHSSANAQLPAEVQAAGRRPAQPQSFRTARRFQRRMPTRRAQPRRRSAVCRQRAGGAAAGSHRNIRSGFARAWPAGWAANPGLVYVATWPDSPHTGLRFENSWNRNSLLLFNGDGWQRGLDAGQRETLRATFTAEQIHRRVRYTDWPGVFTESAAGYLVMLAEGEQARNSTQPADSGIAGLDCRLRESAERAGRYGFIPGHDQR